MNLDLNNCFPVGLDDRRAPLPKQREFLSAALDPKQAKHVAYIGGLGSGKTLIGCITTLIWAVMYPGDYLVARQFGPELWVTTYKTFLEICPPQLIHENRVADRIVRIKSAGGKISNVMFRQLEEPEKLKSLNLSGAYIDEANQVSEAAFMMLQGRLRGQGLRKMIITSNPAGHDYLYRWFVKQDMFKNPEAKKQYKLLLAPTRENVNLPPEYVQSLYDSWSEERIKRELEASFDTFDGAILTEFRRDVHIIRPFDIPKDWTRIMGHDGGFRNAAATVWGAVDYDGAVYVYREHYEKEWLIEEVCKGQKNTGRPGIVALTGDEKIEGCWADPSLRATRGQTGERDWDEYLRHLPREFPLLPANNDVMLGIDRMKSYLKVNERTARPRLYIFDSCSNLLEEMAQYRWKPQEQTMVDRASAKEEPMKVHDHSVDALRYMLMSRPEGPRPDLERRKQMETRDLSWHLRQELEAIRKPRQRDPFGDGL